MWLRIPKLCCVLQLSLILYMTSINGQNTVDPQNSSTLDATVLITSAYNTSTTTIVDSTTIHQTINEFTITSTPTESTTNATTAEPSTASTTAEPSTASTTTEPSTASTTAEPSTASTTAVPSTASTTAEPSTASTTAVPSTASTTAEPSTASTTAEPSTASTTAEPSTASTTAEPSTASTTAEPSTASTTAEPSTASTTAESTTNATTAEPSTASTTAEPSTASTTAEPSTASTTTEPSTASTTTEHTTNATTTELSTISTTSEPTTTSTTTESTTTSTTTTTPETCAITGPYAMNVTHRTSKMFIAVITYNCSLIDLPYILTNDSTSDGCLVTQLTNDTRNSAINVTCNDIVNYAGRDWVFELLGNSSAQIVQNKTFVVTLEPLSLNESSFNITVNEDFTATVIVHDCENISELKYLLFRCNSSEMSNHTFSSNCTITCPNLTPGSMGEGTLIRLPIPKADQAIDNGTFSEDSSNKTYEIGLDKVKDLMFESNSTKNGTGLIHFTRPHGNYENILIDCIVTDRSCSNLPINLTSSVDNTNNGTVPINGIVGGVRYKCKAVTMKSFFLSVSSDNYTFNTNLESAVYNGPTNFSTSNLTFDVISPGDFDSISLTCIGISEKSSVCSNPTVRNDNCSTKFQLNGILGCNYNCSFTTMKSSYSDPKNPSYTDLILFPPIPKFNVTEKGSRWISVKWTINEIANIQSFDLYLNDSIRENLPKSNSSSNETSFSYNYTGLQPFKKYQLQVRLNSNLNVSSESTFDTTLEAAPDTPSQQTVDAMLIPDENDPRTSSTKFVISIDSALFNSSNGMINEYLIYVRQDTKRNASDAIVNGSYDQAQTNQSIDYLAIHIPMNDMKQKSRERSNGNNISEVLGNDTTCAGTGKIPCNGLLKPSTNYAVVVAGCTNGGCAYVMSKIFATINIPSIPPSPLIWPFIVASVVVVLLIVVFVVGLKRRSIRRMYKEKLSSRARPSLDSRPSLLPPSSYQIVRKRPKPLYQYVDLTNEQEKELYAEYQELESTAPQYRQSDYDPDYAVLDRYANIPARGPWENTAVRLTGDHRQHDYINANEIQGLYTDKQYIACQGPLQDTCGDFWDMIIQYEIPKIVMLTKTGEHNPHNPQQTLSKCFRYFPENKGDSLTFDRVTVQVKEVEHRADADLEIRLLLIKDDRKEHRVYHYYFTGWPDFSVIDRKRLIDLIETVDNHGHSSSEKKRDNLLKPMVVHCSAGVGRTGTYIAVDIIRRLVDPSQKKFAEMMLDVMGIVYQLRQNRGKMVQTKEQYILVNRCVEEHLRRINRLDEVKRQIPMYDDAHPNFEVSVSCTPPDEDAGIEGSCSYSKKRKISASTSNSHNNDADVAYRYQM